MLAWLGHHTPLSVWTDASGFPFYRPLSWTVLMALAPGGPFPLHLLNIGLHGLAAVLLCRAAGRLWPLRRWLGPLAGLLFLLYPFSYEVVATTEPVVQTLSLTGMLLAVNLYLARRPLPALLAGFLSIFSGEYGIVLPALLLGLEGWTARCAIAWKRTIPYWGLAGLYLLARSLVPRSSLGDWSPGLEAGSKALYLLQALFYPPALLANPLARTVPIPPKLVLLLLVGLTGGAAVLLLRRSGASVAAAALGWVALNFAPLSILSADYLLNGPRLLYLPSAGIALFWAALLTGLPRPRSSWLTGFLLLTLIALFSLPSWYETCQMIETAEDVVDQFLHSQQEPHDAVIVNFPSWFAPDPPLYPIGKQSFTVLPGFADPVTLAGANRPGWPAGIQIRNLFFGIAWREGRFEQRFYQEPVGWEELAGAIQAGDPVWLYLPTSPVPTLELVGQAHITTPSSPQVRVEGTGLDLSACLLSSDPGGPLILVLEWRGVDPIPRDLTVFAHLYGPDGGLLEQRDGRPLGDLYPFWFWPAGERVRDRRTFSLGPGEGRVVGVGVYEPDTGERLSLIPLTSGVTVVEDGLRIPVPPAGCIPRCDLWEGY